MLGWTGEAMVFWVLYIPHHRRAKLLLPGSGCGWAGDHSLLSNSGINLNASDLLLTDFSVQIATMCTGGAYEIKQDNLINYFI